MAVCIVGAGMAGLAAAIKVKEGNPQRDVLVIEKAAPESNSQISGQRYRTRVSGQMEDATRAFEALLASRNDGALTLPMRKFCLLAAREVEFWIDKGMPYEDKPQWFGPQFGNALPNGLGHGKSALNFMKTAALNAGVRFLRGEVRRLRTDGSRVESLVVHDLGVCKAIRAKWFVLAGGSVGGRMFHSSNKRIHYAPHELAYEVGAALADPTLHFLHPFSRCSSTGDVRIGVFETDRLEGAKVTFDGGEADIVTTSLLQRHQAHYQMDEISKRFVQKGGGVNLTFPDGLRRRARVSYHYCHLGIETTDGVSVKGFENLVAIGDASGVGYWTNHQKRLPGFAMTKCLVDAEVCRERLANGIQEETCVSEHGAMSLGTPSATAKVREQQTYERQLRDINTRHLFEYVYRLNGSSRSDVAESWFAALMALSHGASRLLWELSVAVAHAHRLQAHAPAALEAFAIDRSSVAKLLAQASFRSPNPLPFRRASDRL